MGRPLGHPVNAVSTGKGPENQGCDEKKLLLADLSPGTEVLPATCARVKVRRIPYSSELPIRDVTVAPPLTPGCRARRCAPTAKSAVARRGARSASRGSNARSDSGAFAL